MNDIVKNNNFLLLVKLRTTLTSEEMVRGSLYLNG
jgi:hypothetical protein